MKKRFIWLLVFVLVCSLLPCTPSFAQGIETEAVISLQINNPMMTVNGEICEIDSSGTSPVIRDSRTLVPIRAIIENLSGTVGWDGNTRTVILQIEEDIVQLVIDSTTAYLNGTGHTLDVAPAIINGRTMLPIRFVAESFHLGVAWDGNSQTVTIIKDTFTDAEHEEIKGILPAYSGNAFVSLNNGMPFFDEYEIIKGSFEYYGELDSFGRCDVCLSSVSKETMPTEERESISSVTPTGWQSVQYKNIGYLYNRCHLIGFQLTGENGNKENLITATRHMNVDGMLPFENMVADYVEKTGNHVLYRATPVFAEENLVADGVLLEAYSVEDNGAGLSFCVFCYNVQPSIEIDYKTGQSTRPGEIPSAPVVPSWGVYRTPSGKKYHFDPDCGGKNSYEVLLEDVLKEGLTPCQKCAN